MLQPFEINEGKAIGDSADQKLVEHWGCQCLGYKFDIHEHLRAAVMPSYPNLTFNKCQKTVLYLQFTREDKSNHCWKSNFIIHDVVVYWKHKNS